MNVDNGNYYRSLEEAKAAGEEPLDLVEVFGTEEQVKQLSQKIKDANRAKRKQQKASRKENR